MKAEISLPSRLWDLLVRFRVWVVNMFFMFLAIAPELIQAPELLAIVPESYHNYVVAAAFVVNIWMRPRPALRKSDPEVQVTLARKAEKRSSS